jgi:hypothetical protein
MHPAQAKRAARRAGDLRVLRGRTLSGCGLLLMQACLPGAVGSNGQPAEYRQRAIFPRHAHRRRKIEERAYLQFSGPEVEPSINILWPCARVRCDRQVSAPGYRRLTCLRLLRVLSGPVLEASSRTSAARPSTGSDAFLTFLKRLSVNRANDAQAPRSGGRPPQS